MFKQILNALAVALATAFFVIASWFVLFHIKVLPSGYAVVVYEQGDLLHRIITIFN